jgi:hypothetical protein
MISSFDFNRSVGVFFSFCGPYSGRKQFYEIVRLHYDQKWFDQSRADIYPHRRHCVVGYYQANARPDLLD